MADPEYSKSLKYGMFMEHTYNGPGGRPVQQRTGGPEDLPDREGGLNFKATVGKTGKTNDAVFDKFKSLHEGDRFVDPSRRTLLANSEARKKNVSDAPFKIISPMKQSTTPGDFYGTIGGKIPYEGGNIEVKKKKGEIPEMPRGIYTNPPKKGTFGMNKTTLSERVGFQGVATEYEYQHDPEGILHAKKLAAMEADKKARVTDLPFKPSNPPKKGGFGVPNTTISKGKGVAGEWEYVVGGGGTPAETIKGAGPKIETPFKPSNTHASERLNHIEYIHDPEVPKLEKEAAKKKEERTKLATTGPWKPNIAYKTDMCRSVMRMNLGRA